MTPSVFALFVTHASGYVQVLTFSDRFTRVLYQIGLANQPVTMTVRDY